MVRKASALIWIAFFLVVILLAAAIVLVLVNPRLVNSIANETAKWLPI